MPFADRPDARIWWDQSGTGDPILLIMGHVYGAGMWQLALDHPGRVRSLILGCTAASAGGVPRGALLTRARSLLPGPADGPSPSPRPAASTAGESP